MTNDQQTAVSTEISITSPGEAGIKDVTVVLYSGNDSESTMEYATRFASRYQSRLTAVYVKPYPSLPMTHYGPLPQEYVDTLIEEADRQAAISHAAMEQIGKREGVVLDWKEHTGGVNAEVSPYVKIADIVITGQPSGDDHTWQRAVVNGLVLHSGRPTIVVPESGFEGDIGSEVLIAWDGSQPSARAVHDAFPILRAVENQVKVVSVPVGKQAHCRDTAQKRVAALGGHLDRHGIRVEPIVPDPGDVDTSVVIKTLANVSNVDLIVAGAWGHTRAREYAFGGVTRSLLSETRIPVLFSH